MICTESGPGFVKEGTVFIRKLRVFDIEASEPIEQVFSQLLSELSVCLYLLYLVVEDGVMYKISIIVKPENKLTLHDSNPTSHARRGWVTQPLECVGDVG